MGVQTLLNSPGALLSVYREIHRFRMLEFRVREDDEEGGYVWVRDNHPLASLAARTVVARTTDASAGIELFALSSLLGAGVKAFAPTSLQCQALEATELSADSGDYRQPFPVFCVDLPKGYSKSQMVSDPHVRSHRPGFLTVCLLEDQKAVLFVATMEKEAGGLSASLCWALRLRAGKQREECWEHAQVKELSGMSPEEAELGDRLIRLGLNVALLADNYGTSKVVDSKLEARRARAQDRLRRGIKPEAARLELSRIPTYYEFDQEVVLYRREEGHGGEGEGTGHEVKPHWRRGHWRRQPCGVKGLDRKLIRIAPVLVNAGKVVGEQPAAVYRFSGGIGK